MKGSKRTKKAPSVSRLIKDADRRFSLHIRQKWANKEGFTKCYTCGYRNHWKKMQCGHYLSRFYKLARWHEDNARPQCYVCNVLKRGDVVNYRQLLVAEIGLERVEEVEKLRHIVQRTTPEQVLEVINRYSVQSIAQ